MVNPNIIVYLIMSIIIIWRSTIIMIEKKKILLFLPFFILGILFCLNASFLFFNIPAEIFLGGSKFLFLFILIWIVIIIRRQNGFN